MNPLIIGSLPQQSQREETIPPARVLAALKFLSDVTAKQSTVPYWSEMHGLETIEGQKLAPTEEEARDSACELLRDYFDGKLKPDWRDDLERQAIRKGIEEKNKGQLLHCPTCNPQCPSRNCRICSGSGWCILVPSERSE